MRKFLAIFLLSLYIFGATDAYQLLKMPLFVQHFLYHKTQNPDLTLSGFFQIHYNDGPLVIDDDFEQDMQLPFKVTQVEFSQAISIVIPPQTSSVVCPVKQDANNYFVYARDVDLPAFVYSIFQPPRFS